MCLFPRLSFHDCLKYEDGTGGCDGCLDYTNMGAYFRIKDNPGGGTQKRQFPNAVEAGFNNNLAMTVLALEHIYTRGVPILQGEAHLVTD